MWPLLTSVQAEATVNIRKAIEANVEEARHWKACEVETCAKPTGIVIWQGRKGLEAKVQKAGSATADPRQIEGCFTLHDCGT